MSPRFHAFTLIAVASLTSACSEEESLLSPEPVTSNSQLAVAANYPTGMVAVGDFLFVLVNEAEQQQTDLNGDGDIADNVVHRIDTASGVIANLGMSGSQNFATDGTYVVWAVSEFDEGEVLNSDGDQSDYLLAIFDTTQNPTANNPRVHPVTVNPSVPIQADDGFFAFARMEALEDRILNDDGDRVDVVLGVLDAEDQSVYNPGVASNSADLAFILRNGVLAFTSAEGEDGNDHNGDTDTSDVTLFVHRTGTNTNISIPRAVHPTGFNIVGTPSDPVVAYAIDEANDSNGSLNIGGVSTDVDITDMVAACFDVATATEHIPSDGLAIQPTRLWGSGTRLALSAVEEENGLVPADFNGDGDSDDTVPFWVDLADLDVATNVGLAHNDDEESFFPHVCDEFMFILVDEEAQGGANFNSALGDTDTDDTILAMIDLRTPGATSATNLHIAATQLLCPGGPDPEWILAIAPESDNGDFDMNEDGDTGDEVLAYFPINSSGQISTYLRVASGGGTSNSVATECEDSITIFSFSDEGSGFFFQDLNVDQDTTDVVATAQVISKVTHQFGTERFLGTVRTMEDGDTTAADFPLIVNEHTLAFPTTESALGKGKDLNGDGDKSDSVLFHVTVKCTD